MNLTHIPFIIIMNNFIFLLLKNIEVQVLFHFLLNTLHNWTKTVFMLYLLCNSAPASPKRLQCFWFEKEAWSNFFYLIVSNAVHNIACIKLFRTFTVLLKIPNLNNQMFNSLPSMLQSPWNLTCESCSLRLRALQFSKQFRHAEIA